MRVLLGLVLVVCAPVLGPHSSAWAQGVIRGTVTDSSAAVIPGVLIQVERGFVTREAVSDAQGAFAIERLAPGTLRVSAVLSGFRPYREMVVLAEGENRDLAIRLEPAPLAESVTVIAAGSTYRPGSATTGTKLDLPLIDTPQSVTVITSQVMEDRQVVRMAEVADNVAGVRASPGYGGLSSANYYMRGFRGSFSGGNLRDGFRDYTFLSSRDVQGVEQRRRVPGCCSTRCGRPPCTRATPTRFCRSMA